MATNLPRYATFYDIDVLKYPQMHLNKLSAVIDANVVTMNADTSQRTVVPAGTILALSATRANRVVPYNGTGTILGVLAHSTDFVGNVTNADEAVPVLWHLAIFATAKIVAFTAYASALGNALPTCKFH